MKRISAIFRKEVQDFKSNSQILIMLAMPIVFAVIYGQATQFKEIAANLTVSMAIIFIAGFVQAMIIAEEKEKYTLRVLTLSPASALEVLIGKSLLTGIMTIAVCFINLFILDMLKGNIALLLLIFIIGTVLFSFIGTSIGLIAQSVPQTSVIGMPILMLFLLSDVLEMFIKNETIKDLFQYLPPKNIGEAMNSAMKGNGFSAISDNLLVLAIWLVVSFVITVFIYKKKQLD